MKSLARKRKRKQRKNDNPMLAREKLKKKLEGKGYHLDGEGWAISTEGLLSTYEKCPQVA